MRRDMYEYLWSLVCRRFPEEELCRIRQMLQFEVGLEDAPLHAQQEKFRFYLPGLEDEAWLDPTRFPYYQAVRDASDDLAREARQVIDGSVQPTPYGTSPSSDAVVPEGWKRWLFYEGNSRVDENHAPFPVASRVSDLVYRESGFLRDVGFIVLDAHTRLTTHVDLDNYMVMFNLGAIVPEKCGLEVADKTVEYGEGEIWAFCNSYYHRAWNDSDSPRVLFAVWDHHPGLTNAETRALALLMSEGRALTGKGRLAKIARLTRGRMSRVLGSGLGSVRQAVPRAP